MSETADWVRAFEEQRSRLFALAYRLLGSASEAEDAVQDSFLRWEATDRESVRVPAAWLTRVVTNLCLNRLTAARTRREVYVGPWLPEPVVTTDAALGPLETAVQRESVALALLVLLERLTAAERAVFVLREAFGYPHREIAEVLELTEANCQQLYRRARRHVTADRPRFDTSDSQWRQITERFLTAAQAGNVSGLERTLAADVVSWADGGGKTVAARHPVCGAEQVARYLTGWVRRPASGMRLAAAEVNAQPAILGVFAGKVLGVTVFEVAADKITTVRTIANPDKLTFLSAQVRRPGMVVWIPGPA